MTEYTNDAPDISSNTEPRELIAYAEKRIRDPLRVNGVTIYHFSSHEPDQKALEQATEEKLREDVYVVPFQVTSAWMFIQSILPQWVKEAEILIYREEEGEYYGYNNLIKEVPIESRDSVRRNFAEKLEYE